MNTEYKWYVIYTRSRFEKKVAEKLTDMGIENYLPLVKTLKQWSDRKKKVQEPLFRSYIFVKVNLLTYHKVFEAIGVVSYISIAGGEKPSVPESQIMALRTFLGECPIDETLNIYHIGDEIEIIYGSLQGLRGILMNNKNGNKLLVRIEAINQTFMVTLPHYIVKQYEKNYA